LKARQLKGTKLDYILVTPEDFTEGAEYPLVVLLHGFGANMQDLASLAPYIDDTGYVGGFSEADDPAKLCRPFPTEPFGPDQVNVVSQRQDPDSLFSFLRERIRCYRGCPELGWGSLTVLEHDVRSVLAHRCDWRDGSMLLCHNLGSVPVTVTLSLPGEQPGTECVDLFDRATRLQVAKDGALGVELGAYQGRWFRIVAGPTTQLF